MADLLEKILRDALIIPVTKEVESRLEQICNKYYETITFDKIETLVYSFMFNEKDDDLVSFFCKNYKESYSEELKLSTPVYIVLSEYIVYSLICENNHEIAEKDKAKYSLVVKNTIILCRGAYQNIISPSIIPEMYAISDGYRTNQNFIEKPINSNLASAIFDSDTRDNISITPENIKEFEYMAKVTACAEYEKLILDLEKDMPQNNYCKAYKCAYALAKDPKWKFVDKNPVETLKYILKRVKGRKTLLQIREDLVTSGCLKTFENLSKSSLLLHYFNNKSYLSNIEKQKFAPLEIGVYLYYEFFLERIKK